MDTQELNRDSIIVELREAAEAIFAKWGKVETPFGYIVNSRDEWWICHPSNYNRPVVISKSYANAHDTVGQASTDKILEASSRLSAIVQFLASADFTNKVEGSVSTLKKIQKALA